MENVISSLQNPRIKSIKRLDKPSERRERGLVLIEGLRESLMAVRAGWEVAEIYCCREVATNDELYPLVELLNASQEVFYITPHVYAGIAYREASNGVVTLVKYKGEVLSSYTPPENGLYLIIESVEKPGNLGAMLRTADAAGVDAILLCDSKTDLYNPNAIRSSLGTVFTNKIFRAGNLEAAKWLHENKVSIIAASLQTEQFHYNVNMKTATGIVVGAEASGLSKFWYEQSSQQVKIPMRGKIDSMNVSVSAAILLFEAVRQRIQQPAF